MFVFIIKLFLLGSQFVNFLLEVHWTFTETAALNAKYATFMLFHFVVLFDTQQSKFVFSFGFCFAFFCMHKQNKSPTGEGAQPARSKHGTHT